MVLRHFGNLSSSNLHRLPVTGRSDLRDGIVHSGDTAQTGCSQSARTRPRPGRRRDTHNHLRFRFFCTLTILAVLFYCCSPIHAADAGTRAPRRQKVRGALISGEIIFDGRPTPQPALYRRAEASSIVAPTGTKSNNAAPASSKTSSGSSPTSMPSAPADSTAPLPKPFDGGLGTNYTQPSCPTFLKSMLSNDTFTSCLPFSLLLQVSSDFSNLMILLLTHAQSELNVLLYYHQIFLLYLLHLRRLLQYRLPHLFLALILLRPDPSL